MKRLLENRTESEVFVREFDTISIHLNDVNWSFNDPPTLFDSDIQPFNTRSFINYPGTYVPQIPYSLIEILTYPGATVLDPFTGSGTTFIQALVLGRYPIGCDTNLVSNEYVKTLYKLLDPDLDRSNVLIDIQAFLYGISDEKKKVRHLAEFQQKLVQWYAPKTFNVLAEIIEHIGGIDNEAAYLTLHLAIMSTLNGLSSQDRGWGCIADNMVPKADQYSEKKIKRVLFSKCKAINNSIKAHLKNVSERYKLVYDVNDVNQILLHSDIRDVNVIDDQAVDCVISSPPYPNMTDYITSQRLIYYYLNADPDQEKKVETGARYKRGRKNALLDYLYEMNSINSRITELLKTGGYLVYILPHFKDGKSKVDPRKEIMEQMVSSLKEFGLTPMTRIKRFIPDQRRSHNSKWATLQEENIIIYRKL